MENEKDVSKVSPCLPYFVNPDYAENGVLDIEKIHKSKKRIIVCVDRNIFTDMVYIAKNGALKKDHELKKIANFICFCNRHNFYIMSADAIVEEFFKSNDRVVATQELEAFNFIFDHIESQKWTDILSGKLTNITPTLKNIEKNENSFEFSVAKSDILMFKVAMIHLVRVLRNNNSIETKLRDFASWYRKNCKILSYITIYMISLLAEVPNIKKPKKSQNEEFESIVSGCVNQAFDFYYLAELKKHYNNALINNFILVFATFDKDLEAISSVTHNVENKRGFSGVLAEPISRKCEKYLKIANEEYSKNDKITIVGDKSEFYEKLLEEELTLLKAEI